MREGAERPIPPAALLISVLFAPVFRFVRYFGDDRQDEMPETGDPAHAASDSSAVQPPQSVHPLRITRKNWGSGVDGETHPWFDPVFTELLPGERLVARVMSKTGAWRRQTNGSLRFPHFISYDLSTKKVRDDRTSSSLRFQNRLFETLPWISAKNGDAYSGFPLTTSESHSRRPTVRNDRHHVLIRVFSRAPRQ